MRGLNLLALGGGVKEGREGGKRDERERRKEGREKRRKGEGK